MQPCCRNFVQLHYWLSSSVGTICENGCTEKDGADQCTPSPDDCKCKDDTDACGGTFPASCGTGATPTIKTVCENGCTVIDPAADVCSQGSTPDPCACQDNTDTCGGAFPTSCGHATDTLYSCSVVGATPTVKTVCENVCNVIEAAADQCSIGPDPCACQDNTDTCGEGFPTSCGLATDTLYSCSELGATPTVKTACDNGCSVIESAADQCNSGPDPCACQDTDTVCGSAFPTSCNLSSDTLYSCSAAGATQSLTETCEFGCIVQDGPDQCDSETVPPECLCDRALDTCGSRFPETCGYYATTLYTCAGLDETPAEKTNCTSGCTESATGDDICTDPCLCDGTNDRCGSSWPESCSLSGTSLYTCSAAGEAPQESTNCTFGCIQTTTGCNAVCGGGPDCLCKDDGTHCGTFFPEKCNLAPDGLYKCTNGMAPNETQDCAPGVCSANIVAAASVDGETTFVATTDDFCVDQCASKESNTTACTSTFPAECGYDNKTIVSCNQIGNVPEVTETCTVSCDVETSTCTVDPCTCKATGDTCGSSFPPSCGYESNSFYTCSALEATPEKKQACQDTEVCVSIPRGNDICGPSSCDCVGTGSTCSSEFPPSCNKTADTAITCPGGTETPCPSGCANGLCQNGCTCIDDSSKCGSSFAPSCNLLPNAITLARLARHQHWTGIVVRQPMSRTPALRARTHTCAKMIIRPAVLLSLTAVDTHRPPSTPAQLVRSLPNPTTALRAVNSLPLTINVQTAVDLWPRISWIWFRL
ncbi:MAG: hypothetical protein J3Q66DRAFT_80794 [Benniella sp.]|nr:MAG: hypothetical protein J3Q66DRAFT_80794 [Benniella sp.]